MRTTPWWRDQDQEVIEMRKKRSNPFGIDDDWFKGFFGDSFENWDDVFEQVRNMMEGGDMAPGNVKHYGYSMTIGPDGVPRVKEWGNHRPKEGGPRIQRSCGTGSCDTADCDPDYAEAPGPKLPFPYNPEPNRPRPGPTNIRAKNDLFYEITETEDGLNVYIELPGVKKEDIELEVYDDRVLHLKISGEKKIDRVINLPQVVDPDSVKAKANNGILEVTVKTKDDRKKEGKKIDIE
jgi:HSP20 family protein